MVPIDRLQVPGVLGSNVKFITDDVVTYLNNADSFPIQSFLQNASNKLFPTYNKRKPTFLDQNLLNWQRINVREVLDTCGFELDQLVEWDEPSPGLENTCDQSDFVSPFVSCTGWVDQTTFLCAVHEGFHLYALGRHAILQELQAEIEYDLRRIESFCRGILRSVSARIKLVFQLASNSSPRKSFVAAQREFHLLHGQHPPHDNSVTPDGWRPGLSRGCGAALPFGITR